MKKKIASLTIVFLGISIIATAHVKSKGLSFDALIQIQEQTIPQETPKQSPSAQNTPAEEEKRENASASAALYPDAQLTPGDIIDDLPIDLLCMKGYTKTVRDVSQSTKKKVYEAYGIAYPPPSDTYVIDHLIPLSLGGSNDKENLWPQPVHATISATMKDRLEKSLYSDVCSGEMSLEDAQQKIVVQWYK